VPRQEAVDGVFEADVGRDAADDDPQLGVERFLEAGEVFPRDRCAGGSSDRPIQRRAYVPFTDRVQADRSLRVIRVVNATIPWSKYSSRGFRDRERFKLAI
jgi:hypothetical protein